MGTFSKRAIDFDGSNDYATAGDVHGFERTDAFSMVVWIRTSSTTSIGCVMSKLDQTAPNPGFELFVDMSNNEVGVQLINNATTNYLRVDTSGASPPPNNGQWVHVVATYDGSSTPGGINIYLNGAPQSTATVNNTLSASILSTVDFQVGARDAANCEFPGRIDDAAIYDKELSAGEVIAIYAGGDPPDLRLVGPSANLVGYWLMGDAGDVFPTITDRQVATPILAAGVMKDRSSNSNDGTPVNMEDADFTTDTPGGVSGRSTTMDGVDEYVAIGNVAALDFERTDPFSFSYWIKSSLSTNAYVFSKQSNDAAAQGYGATLLTDGSMEFILRNDNGTSNKIQVDTAGGYNDGVWHHVVWTYSGGSLAANITCYVDGSTVGLTPTVDNLSATIQTSAAFVFGANKAGAASWYDGQLDDFAAYDKELSSDEVTALYNSGAPTDSTLLDTEPDLVGYWGMGEDANDLAMTNMTSGDFNINAAGGNGVCEKSSLGDNFGCGGINRSIGNEVCFKSLGGTEASPYWKMRGEDDGVPAPGYVTWVSEEPDFLGVDSGSSDPPIVGTLIPGKTVVISKYFIE